MEVKNKEKLVILNHPLVEHNFSIIRNKNATCEEFRNALRRISYFLFSEASKDLRLDKIEIETPLQKTTSFTLAKDNEIVIAPILRAGLAFGDGFLDFIPSASVQHIGMYRNEKVGLGIVGNLCPAIKRNEHIGLTGIYHTGILTIRLYQLTQGQCHIQVNVFFFRFLAHRTRVFPSVSGINDHNKILACGLTHQREKRPKATHPNG